MLCHSHESGNLFAMFVISRIPAFAGMIAKRELESERCRLIDVVFINFSWFSILNQLLNYNKNIKYPGLGTHNLALLCRIIDYRSGQDPHFNAEALEEFIGKRETGLNTPAVKSNVIKLSKCLRFM